MVYARKLLRRRGLTGQDATVAAQDAYYDAKIYIKRRRCNFNPLRSAKAYAASCVYNAARDLADAAKSQTKLESLAHEPIDEHGHTPEPDLTLFLKALRLMTHTTRQAVAASQIRKALPIDFPGIYEIDLMIANGPLPENINPNLLSRALKCYYALYKRCERLEDGPD